MIHVGIIGCGKITQVRHAPEFADNPNVVLSGFCSMHGNRAEALAAQYGGRVYETYQEMLADPQIDAVSICTANHTHAEIAIAAFQAGKHVLCEKPMAMTLADCEAMVAAADAAKRHFMIAQNQRKAQAHIVARRLLAEGAIGDIISFRLMYGHSGPDNWSADAGSNTWFFNKDKAIMGVAADLGVHKTDVLHYVTGLKITEVTAQVATLNKKNPDGTPISVDDHAFCLYKLENGVMGTMTVSWCFYGEEDNSTIFYGTKGIMKIYDNPDFGIRISQPGGNEICYKLGTIMTNDNLFKSGIIDSFVDTVLEKQAPEITGREVLATMRAIFACAESARTGKTVPVKQD